MDITGISDQVIAGLILASILGSLAFIWRIQPYKRILRLRVRSPFYTVSDAVRETPEDTVDVPQTPLSRPPQADSPSLAALRSQKDACQEAPETNSPGQPQPTHQVPIIMSADDKRRAFKEELRTFRDRIRDDLPVAESETIYPMFQQLADYIEDVAGKEERDRFWKEDGDFVPPLDYYGRRLLRLDQLLDRIDQVAIRPDAEP